METGKLSDMEWAWWRSEGSLRCLIGCCRLRFEKPNCFVLESVCPNKYPLDWCLRGFAYSPGGRALMKKRLIYVFGVNCPACWSMDDKCWAAYWEEPRFVTWFIVWLWKAVQSHINGARGQSELVQKTRCLTMMEIKRVPGSGQLIRSLPATEQVFNKILLGIMYFRQSHSSYQSSSSCITN